MLNKKPPKAKYIGQYVNAKGGVLYKMSDHILFIL